ncbi:DUF1211 domain-containing protein [Paeniglutamicibacter antarcticus]|uniref:DUF1211 domain-containing protein n=1 Tax=Arthrobacter terrae TaxID=2935737 RepID=A0A931G4M4_9MICC|nr:DUF1211 domain-containing protein [Arthrobacter terrae]
MLQHGSSTDRTVFFSDAVFAIAMTLLVQDLKLPDFPADAGAGAVSDALAAKVPALGSSILSFALVGRTWLNHHRRFGAITRYDGKLQVCRCRPVSFLRQLGIRPGRPFSMPLLFRAAPPQFGRSSCSRFRWRNRFRWRKFAAAQTLLFAAQDSSAKPAAPQQ